MPAPENYLRRDFTRTVAERQLELITPDGRRLLIARLGEPVQDLPTAAGEDWRCPIQIIGWDHTPVPAVGVDSLDALLNGIKMLHIYLSHIERQTGGVLHWLEKPGHFVPTCRGPTERCAPRGLPSNKRMQLADASGQRNVG